MSETITHSLSTLRQMLQGAEIDHAFLAKSPMNPDWFTDYEHQRVENSFLFNYIKIQDKLGASCFDCF